MYTTSMTLDDLYQKILEESTDPNWTIQILQRFFRDKEIITKPCTQCNKDTNELRCNRVKEFQ